MTPREFRDSWNPMFASLYPDIAKGLLSSQLACWEDALRGYTLRAAEVGLRIYYTNGSKARPLLSDLKACMDSIAAREPAAPGSCEEATRRRWARTRSQDDKVYLAMTDEQVRTAEAKGLWLRCRQVYGDWAGPTLSAFCHWQNEIAEAAGLIPIHPSRVKPGEPVWWPLAAQWEAAQKERYAELVGRYQPAESPF